MSNYKKYVTPGLGGANFVSYQCKIIQHPANTSSIEDETTDNWEGNKLADNSFIQGRLKGLTGKILTIIDASLPDGKQNKCVKDLIREVFVNEFSSVSELLDEQKGIYEQVERAEKDGTVMEIATAKDILGA
jgi:hypothetical protein